MSISSALPFHYLILLRSFKALTKRNNFNMAPLSETALANHLPKRDLTVNHTQAVTLGVMAAYVVAIALLWNLPYVRWSLWPFKVSSPPPPPPRFSNHAKY